MKYIFAGYCKTGTKSIGLAFKSLGYRVYDYEETMIFHCDEWLEILNPNTPTRRINQLLYQMYKDIDVVCDAPAFLFWEQILQVFPEAKAIFYERDIEKWYPSWVKQNQSLASLLRLPDIIQRPLLYLLVPTLYKNGLLSDQIFLRFFASALRPRKRLSGEFFVIPEIHARNHYKMHNANFLKNCPNNRRLVIKKFGDWRELCDFIGLEELPDYEFPHENQGGSIVDKTLEGNGTMGTAEESLAKTIKREFLTRLIFLIVFALAFFIMILS